MGKVLISSEYMTKTADAIRQVLGDSAKIPTDKIVDRILAMDSGLSLSTLARGYSSAMTYNKSDLVTYQGKLYACTVNITEPESFDESHWRETTIGDELSTILKAGVADDKYY